MTLFTSASVCIVGPHFWRTSFGGQKWTHFLWPPILRIFASVVRLQWDAVSARPMLRWPWRLLYQKFARAPFLRLLPVAVCLAVAKRDYSAGTAWEGAVGALW